MEQTPNLGGGSFYRRHCKFDDAAAGLRGKNRGFLAALGEHRLHRCASRDSGSGAGRNSDMRKLGDLLPVAPGVEACELVRAHDQHERLVGKLGTQGAQRIDGVRHSTTLDFAHVEHKSRVFRDCKLHHSRPVPGIGNRTLLPRLRRREEADFLERQMLQRVARQL